MAKEVIIDGMHVDLDESEKQIAITLSVNDIAELKDRQASRSNTFRLPATACNRRIFAFADDVNFSQKKQYQRLPARILQDGINILSNGVAMITSFSNFFEVQIVSGAKDFFDRIDALKLSDLNLEYLDHKWDFETVVNSQNNPGGYIWPIIDYGSITQSGTDVYVQELRPALYVGTIISEIIAAAGYSPIGKIFDDELYKSEIIAFSQDEFKHAQRYFDRATNGVVGVNTSGNQNISNDDVAITYVEGTNSDPENRWNSTEYTVAYGTVINLSVFYSLQISRTVSWEIPSNAYYINFQVFRNGAWQTFATKETQPSAGDYPGGSVIYSGMKLDASGNFLANEKIRVFATSKFKGRTQANIFDSGLVITPRPEDNTTYGQDVQMEVNLPDMSQKDFIKDFMQRWALTILADQNKMTVRFASFGEIYRNKYKAKNWTTKITTQQTSTKFSLGNYGQQNIMSYKDDEALPAGFGSGNLAVENQNLKFSNELFSSPFAGSLDVLKLDSVNLAQIKKISKPAEKAFDINTEPRILYLTKIPNVTGVRLVDGIDNNTPEQLVVPYFMRSGLPGLDYQSLIERNYSELRNMLKAVRVVESYVLLNDIDITEFDFFTPIYDGQTASYYYVNEISNYVSGQITKVTLIRL